MDNDKVNIDISHEALNKLPTLDALGVPLEILEAVEEICDTSDVLGVERHKLELIVRLVIAHDRTLRKA